MANKFTLITQLLTMEDLANQQHAIERFRPNQTDTETKNKDLKVSPLIPSDMNRIAQFSEAQKVNYQS